MLPPLLLLELELVGLLLLLELLLLLLDVVLVTEAVTFESVFNG
jgi:hypothetical protein